MEYHCGMCELSWLAHSVPSRCPHCETDQIETKEAALSHHTLEHEWYDPEYDQCPRYT
jgi:hypothetical protein